MNKVQLFGQTIQFNSIQKGIMNVHLQSRLVGRAALGGAELGWSSSQYGGPACWGWREVWQAGGPGAAGLT